jgi:hypothetical protein
MLRETKQDRSLERFDEYQREWKMQEKNLNRKVSSHANLMSTLGEYREKREELETLSIAQPNALEFGNNAFYMSLRS